MSGYFFPYALDHIYAHVLHFVWEWGTMGQVVKNQKSGFFVQDIPGNNITPSQEHQQEVKAPPK